MGSRNWTTRQRLVALPALAAALLGALGLLGWALGLPRLTSLVPGYRAIAPSAALALVILGIAMARQASGRIGRAERSLAASVLALTCLAALLEIIGSAVNADLNLEDAATAYLAAALRIPFHPMSPASGVLLFLLAADMLALLFQPVAAKRARSLGQAAGALGALSAAIALVFVMGYVYRTPLLYGSGAIPIAATAALGCLLLSVGAVLSAGPEHWPLRALAGSSTRARLMRAFVPLTVLAVIASSIISDFLAGAAHVNHALLDSLLATACVVIAAIVASRLARGIGEVIDRAQAAQQAAERARTELAENLQHEIAHRVRNNLAMVASLLEMQVARQPERGEAGALRQAIARVYTFASLHELIYETGGEVVDVTAAIRRIAAATQQALGASTVQISVTGEPVACPMKAATNLCAIANELLTNGIKHGRPAGADAAQVAISLARQGHTLTLSVWSSGNPIPDAFDPTAQRTMGLRLVSEIATAHYGGSFTIRPHHGGTLATVTLDEPRLRRDT
jgi:two-component sensor histidine kinase